MHKPLQVQLKGSYQDYLEKGDWQQYFSELCSDGLTWWFEHDIPTLVSHLIPINGVAKYTYLPDRILLFLESINPAASLDRLEELFSGLQQDGDVEGAVAAAGAAIALIWGRGTEFSVFADWHEKLETLEGNPEMSQLAWAYLCMSKANVEYLGLCDLQESRTSFESALHHAEMARSPSLIVIISTGLGNVMAHMADLTQMEIILANIKPIAKLPDISSAARTHYLLYSQMYLVFVGRLEEALGITGLLLADPVVDMLPSCIWYLFHMQILGVYLQLGDKENIKALTEKLANLVIPKYCFGVQSIMQVHLGLAALNSGDAQKGLEHGREAFDRTGRAQVDFHRLFGALLVGQALVDLNRAEEGREHLHFWINWLLTKHFRTFAGIFYMELAQLELQQGRRKEARNYFGKGLTAWRNHFPFSFYNRSPVFYSKLRKCLQEQPETETLWIGPDQRSGKRCDQVIRSPIRLWREIEEKSN